MEIFQFIADDLYIIRKALLKLKHSIGNGYSLNDYWLQLQVLGTMTRIQQYLETEESYDKAAYYQSKQHQQIIVIYIYIYIDARQEK